MHSEKYAEVEKYYRLGLWTKQKVKKAVSKGWITAEEYAQITGDEL